MCTSLGVSGRFIVILCVMVFALATPIAGMSVQAQQPCELIHSFGWALSGSGSNNRGTQGLVTIPTSYEVDTPYGFLAQSVWVFASNNGYYSAEVGYGYGYSGATGTYKSFYTYYQAAHSGQYQWDDSRPLTVGGSYYLSSWFTRSDSGAVTLNAYATPNGGGYPTWSNAVSPPGGWG
jgi:hypothetical protein